MKKEEKDLLLKDICGRLPYGVKAVLKRTNCHNSTKHKVNEKDIYSFRTGKPLEEDYGQHDYYKVIVTDIKPYLFPLSNITEEQKKDLLLTVVGKEGLKLFSVTKDGIVSNDKSEQSLYNFSFNNVEFSNETTEAYIDWLNKNHFDYRGLIEKSLALDASGLNIY